MMLFQSKPIIGKAEPGLKDQYNLARGIAPGWRMDKKIVRGKKVQQGSIFHPDERADFRFSGELFSQSRPNETPNCIN